LNTTPQVAGYTKRDAVSRTIQLINKVLGDRETGVKIDLERYQRLCGGMAHEGRPFSL